MGESKTMKRIRVLHSELNGELGGIESFLYNVYRFIDKEKVEFDFLTISDTPAYGDKFKKMGSTVYKVPKHINFLGYYFAIDKILREGNYDIVHIHKNSAIDILILKVLQRFPNIKVVVHSHNTFPSVGGKLEKLHKFNRKYLYDNADYRLACSDNAGKWMYGNGAFEIIKNGIDTKGFRFCTEYGEEIRAMYGIPMNAFVIGHVGRFTNQKNHSKLIDIFAAIKERKSDAYLLLLGGGELQDTIKSKVEKLNLCDSVIFCGVRTDVNKYLCAMDAFVFPSTWEGLGIVAIEAQASGLECYLSRELPKEVEVTDAVTWFDVSENENAIANMIDLTKVPEETRYIRNREVAENGYDMQETANRLMKIYLSLIGESTIIGYYYYSKEKEIDTKTQLLYNMQIISLSIALMTAFVPLINRVLYYGMAYELLYLPNMLKLINNRREKMLVKVFLILMYGGITAYGMINSGWYTCIPYNFYFDYR